MEFRLCFTIECGYGVGGPGESRMGARIEKESENGAVLEGAKIWRKTMGGQCNRLGNIDYESR